MKISNLTLGSMLIACLAQGAVAAELARGTPLITNAVQIDGQDVGAVILAEPIQAMVPTMPYNTGDGGASNYTVGPLQLAPVTLKIGRLQPSHVLHQMWSQTLVGNPPPRGMEVFWLDGGKQIVQRAIYSGVRVTGVSIAANGEATVTLHAASIAFN